MGHKEDRVFVEILDLVTEIQSNPEDGSAQAEYHTLQTALDAETAAQLRTMLVNLAESSFLEGEELERMNKTQFHQWVRQEPGVKIKLDESRDGKVAFEISQDYHTDWRQSLEELAEVRAAIREKFPIPEKPVKGE